MGIVNNSRLKIPDTFPARYLHELRREPDISSFIEYRVKTGYSLGTTQKRRKGNITL